VDGKRNSRNECNPPLPLHKLDLFYFLHCLRNTNDLKKVLFTLNLYPCMAIAAPLDFYPFSLTDREKTIKKRGYVYYPPKK